MPTIVNALFDGVRPQYFDTMNGLKPLSGGRLIFCNAGTSTLKAIYSNAFDRLTPLTNPLILDADGYVPEGGVWLGDGAYKVFWQRRLNPDQSPEAWGDLWETDNILGVNTGLSSGSGLNVIYLNNVSELQSLDPTGIDLIGVTGYYTENDLGGVRWFKWYESNSTPTDNGMIFARTASPTVGRFIGVLDGQDYIPASWYGATASAPYPVNSRILALQSYCANNKKTMFLQGGTYYLDNDLTLNIGGSLVLDVGVVFRREASAPTTIQINITPLSLLINGKERINYSSDELIKIAPTTLIDLLPEWWGLDYAKIITSGSKGRLLFTQGYNIGGTSLDFSGFECYFKADSFMNSTLFVANRLTFGIVNSDLGAYNIFRVTSGEPYPYLFKNDVYAKWLISDSANYLDADHTRICISASNNGTEFGRVIYDLSFTQRENTTDTNYTRLITAVFKDVQILSFGTNTRYKFFANDFEGEAFVSQTNPIQPIPQGDLLVSWYDFRFGANSTQSANNANIFYEMIYCAAENNIAIDGQNKPIKFDGDATTPSASGGYLTIKNMNVFSNYIINLNNAGGGISYLLIMDSEFSALGSAQSCTLRFLEGDNFYLSNCTLTYAIAECDNNVYINNNRFFGSFISNSTGENIRITNNYCKAQVNDTSFIYIGATLEPQKWFVKGNTFVQAPFGIAEMFNVGGRNYVYNALITCAENFGGERCATKITLRNKTTLANNNSTASVVPIGNKIYFFSLASGAIINEPMESFVIMRLAGIAPTTDNWVFTDDLIHGISMLSIPVAIGTSGFTFKITTSSAD